MLVKFGVYGEIHDKLTCKFKVITEIWDPEEPVITAIAEGTHVPNSKHYYHPSRAIDLRMPGFATVRADKLKEALGPEYTVLNEGSHIHVQFND